MTTGHTGMRPKEPLKEWLEWIFDFKTWKNVSLLDLKKSKTGPFFTQMKNVPNLGTVKIQNKFKFVINKVAHLLVHRVTSFALDA